MITMIVVCAVDYFEKKNGKCGNELFSKNHKKLLISENLEVWCFSSRLDGFEITCTSIRKKTAHKTLIFFKNLIFAFLNPKTVK